MTAHIIKHRTTGLFWVGGNQWTTNALLARTHEFATIVLVEAMLECGEDPAAYEPEPLYVEAQRCA